MCKQRFYWIEREVTRKKEKEGEDTCDGSDSKRTNNNNDNNNNAREQEEQREKPIYCPLKNQGNEGQEEEDDGYLDPAEHIICTICQSGDDERNLLLCDGCDEGYHVSCVGLQRVPRGRWHCPSCASWEREREEREENRRRLSGMTSTTTTTTTRTRTDGSTSRAARMARAPRGDGSPSTRLGMLEALVNPTNEDAHSEMALRENALLGSAANEDPTHRENRLVRERRQATRMRNGEVRLSGGGGGSSTFNRGDSHRRRQIAIVQELREAWERLMKEEEEFPDVDEVALMIESRRGGNRNNTSNSDLERMRSNANIDVETAWKLMDSARAEEEKEKRMKRTNRKKKVALGRSAEENEQQPSSSLQPRNASSTDTVKRPKIRVRSSTDHIYNNSSNDNNVLGVQGVPSFLRDTLGDAFGANNAKDNDDDDDDNNNVKKEEEEEEEGEREKRLPPPQIIDVSRAAADAAKALLIQPFKEKILSKDQYKNTVKAIVKKCVEADKNMQRLRAGSITDEDIKRIARIDAEEVVLAAEKSTLKVCN